MTKADFDKLFSVSGAAEFLQLSESWLNKGRVLGYGPRFLKMGRSVRYSLAGARRVQAGEHAVLDVGV
jgi:hypothetical protein